MELLQKLADLKNQGYDVEISTLAINDLWKVKIQFCSGEARWDLWGEGEGGDLPVAIQAALDCLNDNRAEYMESLNVNRALAVRSASGVKPRLRKI